MKHFANRQGQKHYHLPVPSVYKDIETIEQTINGQAEEQNEVLSLLQDEILQKSIAAHKMSSFQ